MGLFAGNVSRVVDCFNILLPDIKMTELTKMELLGSPILNGSTRGCIMKKLSDYEKMSDRIILLNGHPGLFPLKNAFSHLRILFSLRTVTCHHHSELLAEYDSQIEKFERYSVLLICRHHGSLTQPVSSACFKAVSRPESGAWLSCIPNNRVGTFIDNDTICIGVSLRIGLSVCTSHRCKCGMTVDAFGMHPMFCASAHGAYIAIPT